MSSPGPACPVTNTLLEITRGERGVGVDTKLRSSQANNANFVTLMVITKTIYGIILSYVYLLPFNVERISR